MDLLDRIARLLRALLSDSPSSGTTATNRPGAGTRGRGSARPADPDLAAAWEELDDYLDADRATSGAEGRAGSQRTDRRGSGAAAPPPGALRGDYANLEVPFGADIETVRRSYKRLMLHYHPDRHGSDPEKQRVATEITKKLNESFERIRAYQESRGGGDR